MCIGTPLQVVEPAGSFAWCEAGDDRECLDMRLVGDQPVGTWVLGFNGAARQVLSAQEAAQATAARQALAAVLSGYGCVDDFFADLIGREPQLPAHLLPAHLLPADRLPADEVPAGLLSDKSRKLH